MVEKTAFVFPGQGSQYVGMGKIAYEKYTSAKETFDAAEEILCFPLKKICFEGPEEILTLTQNAQPAILVTSIALYKVFTEKNNIHPAFVFGHSLGEFTALHISGVFDFQEVLNLVRIRGQLMGDAGKKKPGTMCAILGMEREKIENLIKEYNSPNLVLANINCPGQFVISGDKEDILKFQKIALDNGAKRVIPLNVSAAFHSPLMDEPAKEFTEILKNAKFNLPAVPVVMNSTGKIAQSIENIKNALFKQLRSPVYFWDSVEELKRRGLKSFIEIGPGRVLSGLIKRIYPLAEVFNFDGSSL